MRPMIAVLLLSLMFSGKNLLRNGDFEKFTGDEPDGWTTTNIPKTLTVVSASTRAHAGKSAVRCDVKPFFGAPTAGMISQKNIPISGTTLRLTGYYILKSIGKDAAFITLELQTADGSTVKICEQNILTSAEEFTSFTVTGGVPATAAKGEIRFTLLPGKGSEKLHEGSYLILDDLALSGELAESDILPE